MRRPVSINAQRLRDQFHKLFGSVGFERFVVADPKRRESIVNEIERDASHAFKLRFVDLRIEIRIDRGLGDAEMIGFPKRGLRNVRLNLVLRHAEAKAEQFRSSGQLAEFLRALRRRSLGQQEEHEREE